jgi:hypothetical protein
MKANQINRNLRAIIDGSNINTMNATMYQLVFNALKHGTVNPKLIKETVESNAPTLFRKALKVNLPLTLNTLTKELEFNASKKVTIIEKLGLSDEFTYEDVANCFSDDLFKSASIERKASEKKTDKQVNDDFKVTSFSAKQKKVSKLSAVNLTLEMQAVKKYLAIMEAEMLSKQQAVLIANDIVKDVTTLTSSIELAS